MARDGVGTPITTDELLNYWKPLTKFVSVITSEDQLLAAQDLLGQLRTEEGGTQNHQLHQLTEVLSVLIRDYAQRRAKQSETSGAEAVKAIMIRYNLRQKDLPELGSQGVVSEILCGKRKLNLRQAKALCERFDIALTALL